MKILICPDKFKGSLTAKQVCLALKEGIECQGNILDIEYIPLADGGDGSIEIIKELKDLTKVTSSSVDALGRPIVSSYYMSDEIAFIELASASGLVQLEKEERNPMLTSTFGTGLMIKHALENGIKRIKLFIGGSATNDGGIGIAKALGFNFYDSEDNPVHTIGASLSKIARIENTHYFDFEQIEIDVMCDVQNPLFGSDGAARVYAAQKGASQADIEELDRGLKNISEMIYSYNHIDVSQTPGMGAAGGVSATLVGLMGASLKNGFQMISELTNLEHYIKEADLVITGEGKIDNTSFQGKVVGNVIKLCEAHNIEKGIVAGVIDEGIPVLNDLKFKESILSRAGTSERAMENAYEILGEMGKEIAESLFSTP